MFIYSYSALNSDDTIINDTIISKSKRNVYLDLIDNNKIPLNIRLKSILIFNSQHIHYRVHFFHQLSTLISSGINLLQCLTILHNNCQLPYWRHILSISVTDIKKGSLFSDTLSKHKIVFSGTIINLIKVAEKTGAYENNFRVIVKMLEHNQNSAQQIRKSLRYPVTLLCFSIILVWIMLIYVLPQFSKIYQNFQHELPFLTKLMIYFSNLLIEHSLILLLGMTSVIIIIFKYKNHCIHLSIKFASITPLLKKLVQTYHANIYFLTLSSTLQAGLPLTECLKCATEAIHHPPFKKTSLSICQAVEKGESLSSTIQHHHLFPSIAPQLLAIAEESGQLAHFSQYLFNYFSVQYLTLTEKSLKNLEPILLLLMAFLVGSLMLAMYMPIFNLGNVITGI